MHLAFSGSSDSASRQGVRSKSGLSSMPEVYSCGLCWDSGPEQMSSRFRAHLLLQGSRPTSGYEDVDV